MLYILVLESLRDVNLQCRGILWGARGRYSVIYRSGSVISSMVLLRSQSAPLNACLEMQYLLYQIEIYIFYWVAALRYHNIYHLLVSIIQCALEVYWLITPEKKSVRRL